MNAAARLLQHSHLSGQRVFSILFDRVELITIVLMLATLISALSVVYVTNTSRNLNALIQQTLVERDRLYVQKSQMLLEKGTWVTPARVQKMAEKQLNMIAPDRTSVVILSE
jgi:cell division protein FtsL